MHFQATKFKNLLCKGVTPVGGHPHGPQGDLTASTRPARKSLPPMLNIFL